MKLHILAACTVFSGGVALAYPQLIWAQDTTPEATDEASLLPYYSANPEFYDTEAERLEIEADLAIANSFNATLTPQTGQIELSKAGAVLDMGETHYFLNPADSKKVLVDNWENPYNANVLGMIFERETDAYSNDYAVIVYFEDIGYVSDEDAATIDYDELLVDMKKQTRAESKSRKETGYDGIQLLGWGGRPAI